MQNNIPSVTQDDMDDENPTMVNHFNFGFSVVNNNPPLVTQELDEEDESTTMAGNNDQTTEDREITPQVTRPTKR